MQEGDENESGDIDFQHTTHPSGTGTETEGAQDQNYESLVACMQPYVTAVGASIGFIILHNPHCCYP